MNLRSFTYAGRRRMAGLTLVEVMIASGLGLLVLACVGSLTLYGARTSVALMNYTDLDSKSRYAADIISREMRQAYRVIAFETNPPTKWVTVSNATERALITLRWDSDDRTLTLEKTDREPFVALTECDRWDFSLYQRTPIVTSSNLLFFPATNSTGHLEIGLCKLIDMSWKCSRTILAQKVNTETVQAAQIVLRNKP